MSARWKRRTGFRRADGEETIHQFLWNGIRSREVKNPKQDSLKLLDMTVLRNAYGRQIASDVVSGPTKLKSEPLEMVFIRGPIIERSGPGVKVLAEYAGKPALVQRDQIMAATF